MKYKVTCDNCGREFLVEAEPGQTVRCECPGCGGTMRFVLPRQASETVLSLSDAPRKVPRAASVRAPKGNRRLANRLLTLLLVCFSVLVVLAVIFLVTSRYTNRPVEPESSGYLVDTVAIMPNDDFELETSTDTEPEIDTVIVDKPPVEAEPEQNVEPEVADSL